MVKNAKPRFPGHEQPKVPLWGYADESDPKVMAQKIDAAADHGIDAFIFDWYCYNDGPFLEKALDEGYLKAPNRARLKFALMWANHDWIDLHPYARGRPQTLLYPGKVSPEAFDAICDHIVKDYFSQPTYWTIDGKPYFSFYELSKLLDNFGSIPATRAALDRFRAKARAAGLTGIHLNAVVWGQPILPGENKPLDAAQLVKDLGFDSVTSVCLDSPCAVARDADRLQRRARRVQCLLDDGRNRVRRAVFPERINGLGPQPAGTAVGYLRQLRLPIHEHDYRQHAGAFKEALIIARDRLARQPHAAGQQILTINSWNEWTEGSYIEPDTKYGLQYLEAIRDVFGVRK